MSDKEVFLDLNKVRLYGYESGKSDKVIDAVVRGIEQGDVFPPVIVCQVTEDEYLILRPDGGHNRAVGHYIANKPLRCIVRDIDDPTEGYVPDQKVRDFVEADWPERVFIGDVELVDDDKIVANYEHRKRTRVYR